ncbi:MAG TPA: BlaI/MecI/CopY family transcriptional regulator [Vicinamibacterales bacterium]|jgi:predicted transcriptional regulator
MARRRSPTLTDVEVRIMTVLWDKERASVGDVIAALKPKYSAAYSTVQTMLRILETKGYVKHEKSGRAFIYRPLIDQRQARRRALSHLVSRLFDNSPSLLVLNVLEDDRIDPAELDRLKKLIQDARQED